MVVAVMVARVRPRPLHPAPGAWAGRVAVVTGANAGVGKATARRLALGGFKVVIACRSPEKAAVVADDINRELKSSGGDGLGGGGGGGGGGSVVPMTLDLASRRSIRAFAAAFIATGMGLDALVCNAGLAGTGSEHLTTLDGCVGGCAAPCCPLPVTCCPLFAVQRTPLLPPCYKLCRPAAPPPSRSPPECAWWMPHRHRCCVHLNLCHPGCMLALVSVISPSQTSPPCRLAYVGGLPPCPPPSSPLSPLPRSSWPQLRPRVWDQLPGAFHAAPAAATRAGRDGHGGPAIPGGAAQLGHPPGRWRHRRL